MITRSRASNVSALDPSCPVKSEELPYLRVAAGRPGRPPPRRHADPATQQDRRDDGDLHPHPVRSPPDRTAPPWGPTRSARVGNNHPPCFSSLGPKIQVVDPAAASERFLVTGLSDDVDPGSAGRIAAREQFDAWPECEPTVVVGVPVALMRITVRSWSSRTVSAAAAALAYRSGRAGGAEPQGGPGRPRRCCARPASRLPRRLVLG